MDKTCDSAYTLHLPIQNCPFCFVFLITSVGMFLSNMTLYNGINFSLCVCSIEHLTVVSNQMFDFEIATFPLTMI